MADTADSQYTDRLVGLQHNRWKQLLGAQVPYRWNIRRLLRGYERVLDIGCGIGRNLEHLGRGVGVDHNETAVEVARAAGLRAWTTAEWSTSPDAVEGGYDALVVAHVLEHLHADEAEDVLHSYLKYAAPGARLVLICPQERGYASDATHVRWMDLESMSGSARGWGFHPVMQASFPFPRSAGKWFTYNEFVVVADRS